MPGAITTPEELTGFYVQKFNSFLETVTMVFIDVAARRNVGELNFLIMSLYHIAQQAKDQIQMEGVRLS